jgi:hypothetical protein
MAPEAETWRHTLASMVSRPDILVKQSKFPLCVSYLGTYSSEKLVAVRLAVTQRSQGWNFSHICT